METKKFNSNNDNMYLDCSTILDEYGDTLFYTNFNDNCKIYNLLSLLNNLQQINKEQFSERVNNTLSNCINFGEVTKFDQLLLVEILTTYKRQIELFRMKCKSILIELDKIDLEVSKINLI